jgi:MFS family permease
MTPEVLRRTAVVATVAVLAVVAIVSSIAGTAGVDTGGVLFAATVVLLIGGAGLFVYRVPDETVPWILFALASAVGAGQVAFAARETAAGALRVVLGVLAILGWWPSVVLGAVFLPLLFPTGRPLGPGWRWVAWGGVACIVVTFAWGVVAVVQDCPSCLQVGVSWLDVPYQIAQGAVAVLALAALASLVVRYARSVGVERKQLQWLLFPIAIALVGLLLEVALPLPIDPRVVGIGWGAGILGIPVGIVVAITRHGLYEIDRIIRRTVSYSIVIGGLGLVFAAGAIWIPRMAGVGSSALAVAVSTLVVATSFNPVRGRVQRTVDRRFHRLPYDPDEVLADLRIRLRGEVEPHQVAVSLATVATAALSPRLSVVWLKEPA